MSQKFDVLIIGGGAIGCATAFFLTKMSPHLKVALVEKADELGTGATGSWGSLLREFSVLPHISERAIAAFPHFMQFTDQVGEPLIYNQTGSLYFFKASHRREAEARFQVLAPISQTGMELIEFEEGRLRFPAYQWMPGDFAIYEARAGFVDPASAVWGWANAGLKRGLVVKTQIQVTEVLLNDKGYASGVLTTDGVLEANCLVMAAGPWVTDSLLSGKLESLPVTRVPLQINRYRSSQPSAGLPFFIDAETCSFARMSGSDVFGGYVPENVESEKSSRQPLSVATAAESKRRLSKRLKWLRTADVIGGVCATETYTKDSVPVMGFSRQVPNIYVATGWSCTGFMLAPFYGEQIARQVGERL